MNLHKYVSILIFTLILSCCLPICVTAHPGNTDSQGGHYDQSTGEYHYHHGYPAHQHYDMDGDGDIDCPYEFDDKTGENSGGSSGSVSDGTTFGYGRKPRPSHQTETIPAVTNHIEKVRKVPVWLAGFLTCLSIILAVSIAVLVSKNRALHNEILFQAEKFKAEREDCENAAYEEINGFLCNLTCPEGSEKVIRRLAKVPKRDNLDKHMLPINTDTGTQQWGSKYTFYSHPVTYSTRTLKYHRAGCRYASCCIPVNAYEINHGSMYHPCRICHPQTPDTDWVDEYKKYKKLFQKYGVDPSDVKYSGNEEPHSSSRPICLNFLDSFDNA